MENAYGIGITNRYALFLDEEADPLDILKQSEKDQLAAKNKKIEAATKPASKVAPVKSANNRNESDKENNAKNNRFEGKRVLDARRTNDGPREERNNQRNRDGEVRRGDDDGERRGGGRGRGRGGPGGDRGGRGRGGPGGRGGKREFDRKSGDSRTGIKPEEKRGGSGKGNWGNFEDDVKADGDETNNTSVEEPIKEGEEAENKEEAVEDRAPKEDDEPKTMTLDEWKAQQVKKEGPKFNVRKPGEGQKDDPKWKKATIYKKENEEESEEEEEEEVVYLQRANRQKKVNINFTFADESRGGRGGPGRGRGGRGRGGERREGGDRRDDGERRERRERPERSERQEDGGRDGGAPRRGGPRGGYGGERGAPRGGRGGDRGGRGGGRKEFSLDQDAFPTLG